MNAFSPTAANSSIVVQLFQGVVMLLGTVFTLASFHFSASRAQDGTVRHIGKTEDSDATCVHTPPEVGTGTRCGRCEALRTGVRMHINRDVVTEHLLGS